MERYGGLKDSKTGDRQAVATALGKLLRLALEALPRGNKLLPGASRGVVAYQPRLHSPETLMASRRR